MGGTGYRYAPVRLTGEVALLNSEVVKVETEKCGAPEIQFARFRSFDLSDAIYEDVLPFHVEPAGNAMVMVPSGWSPFTEVTEEDGVVFDKAMEGFVGVKYTPERVSKQIVNGMNYRFFCYGDPAILGGYKFPASVIIHVSPKHEVQLVKIERVVL